VLDARQTLARAHFSEVCKLAKVTREENKPKQRSRIIQKLIISIVVAAASYCNNNSTEATVLFLGLLILVYTCCFLLCFIVLCFFFFFIMPDIIDPSAANPAMAATAAAATQVPNDGPPINYNVLKPGFGAKPIMFCGSDDTPTMESKRLSARNPTPDDKFLYPNNNPSAMFIENLNNSLLDLFYPRGDNVATPTMAFIDLVSTAMDATLVCAMMVLEYGTMSKPFLTVVVAPTSLWHGHTCIKLWKWDPPHTSYLTRSRDHPR
jgi:hypothetical protein